jgi:hypothetical protein
MAALPDHRLDLLTMCAVFHGQQMVSISLAGDAVRRNAAYGEFQ